MSRDANHNGDNPFQPTARGVRDPAHDAQLLRELAIINALTVASLGALPVGGVPATPKRKPQLPMPLPFAATPTHEDEHMELREIAAAALLPLAVAGCARSIDAGSATAHLNPHPVKRYEVIATSKAPGPWDSIEGTAFFDVLNKKCVPQDWYTGAQSPPNTWIKIKMTRIGDNTWKGYFYRDALQNEDYFDLGVCRWDVTSVSVNAKVQGVRLNWGDMLGDLLRDGRETWYFKKSVYGNRSLAPYGPWSPDLADAEIRQHLGDYFPVTIAVKETAP